MLSRVLNQWAAVWFKPAAICFGQHLRGDLCAAKLKYD